MEVLHLFIQQMVLKAPGASGPGYTNTRETNKGSAVMEFMFCLEEAVVNKQPSELGNFKSWQILWRKNIRETV